MVKRLGQKSSVRSYLLGNLTDLATYVCTVFWAEDFTLMREGEVLVDVRISNRNISLYVDSQAAILALSTVYTYPKLEKNYKPVYCVPGYDNQMGNEEADRLVRRQVRWNETASNLRRAFLPRLGLSTIHHPHLLRKPRTVEPNSQDVLEHPWRN